MQELSGRVAVVTGAGGGIGRALAERFAEEGMRVALADVDERVLRETEAVLAARGTEVTARVVDVSDAAAILAFADHVFDAFGDVHVLCNNAGVFAGGLIWERPTADMEWVLGVNFWGIVHGIRAFGRSPRWWWTRSGPSAFCSSPATGTRPHRAGGWTSSSRGSCRRSRRLSDGVSRLGQPSPECTPEW